MMIFNRIVGVVFSMLVVSAAALRFNAIRERLYMMWPQSRRFLDRYYPLDLRLKNRISQGARSLRRRGIEGKETTRTRYGENLPGEAK